MKKKVLLIFSLLVVLSIILYKVLPMDQKKDIPSQIKPTITAACPNFTVVDPIAGQTVTAPFTVTAIVNNTISSTCSWTVFEGQAGTMTLKDAEGTIIGTGILATTEDWMTEEAVQYTGSITFTKAPASSEINLEITEENPGDHPDPDTIIIPLIY